MAKLDELSARLLRRLSGVETFDVVTAEGEQPKPPISRISRQDTDDWVLLAMNEHGFAFDNDVPTSHISLILLYAEADAASTIALRSAKYFHYKDGEETVDKKTVSEAYRKIATELWKKYDKKKIEISLLDGTSRFTVRSRADGR